MKKVFAYFIILIAIGLLPLAVLFDILATGVNWLNDRMDGIVSWAFFVVERQDE